MKIILNANIAAMQHAADGSSSGCLSPVSLLISIIILWVIIFVGFGIISFISERCGERDAVDIFKEGIPFITKVMIWILFVGESTLCLLAALGLIPWVGIE